MCAGSRFVIVAVPAGHFFAHIVDDVGRPLRFQIGRHAPQGHADDVAMMQLGAEALAR